LNILAQPKSASIKQNVTLILTCLLWVGVLVVVYDHFFSSDNSTSDNPVAAVSESAKGTSPKASTGTTTAGMPGAESAANASIVGSEITEQRKPQRLASIPTNPNLRQQIVSASPNPAEADAAISAVQSLRVATLLVRRDKILAERAKYQHEAQQWRDKTAALGKPASGNAAFQTAAASVAGGSGRAGRTTENVEKERVSIDDISLRAIVKDAGGYRASFSISGKNAVSGRNGGVLTNGIRIKSIASDRAVLVSGAENRTLYAY